MIGKEIMDFERMAYWNGEFVNISKEDLLGNWNLLFFYPADFTFVCPTELEDLQNHYEEFKECGCEIYSVSCDTHFVHKGWAKESERVSKIQYPMLADPTGKLAADFGAYCEDSGQAMRCAAILDPDGKICSYEIVIDGVGRNADEILRKLQACQFVAENGDQVCPANWHPGEETLKPSLDLVGML